MLSKRKITFIFTIVLSFYPLLLMISVKGPLRLGDLLLSILSLIIFIKALTDNARLKVNIPVLVIILYVFLMFAVNFVFQPVETVDLRDYLHYIYALFIIAFLVPDYFDMEIGMKALRLLVVANSCIIILQYILMKFSQIYLLEHIPSVIGGSIRAYFDAEHPRPFGLFSEPSAFAWTAVIYLTLELFRKKPGKQKWGLLFVTVLALIFSKSASGIALLVIILLGWGSYKLLNDGRSREIFIVLAPLLAIVVTVVLVRSGALTFFIGHIYDAESNSVGHGMLGRIGTLFKAFTPAGKTLREILFGNGIIPLTEYYSGISRMLCYWGYAGVILNYLCCFFLYLEAAKKRIPEAKMLIFLACIYNVFSAVMVGITPLLWMPYVLAWRKEDHIIWNRKNYEVNGCEAQTDHNKYTKFYSTPRV